jgi:hypothetical protein
MSSSKIESSLEILKKSSNRKSHKKSLLDSNPIPMQLLNLFSCVVSNTSNLENRKLRAQEILVVAAHLQRRLQQNAVAHQKEALIVNLLGLK